MDGRTKAGKELKSKESKPSNPKFFEETPKPEHQLVAEAPKSSAHDARFSGKCRKFMIHRGADHLSPWAFAGPGTLPPVHIQRGQIVILPEEYFECFKSAGVEALKCDMDFPAGGRPEYYTQYETNYPYQDFGEVSWEEYLEFKGQNDKKEHPNKSKKRG